LTAVKQTRVTATPASTMGRLMEEPATVRLAHSVQMEATSLPTEAADEQLGQQAFMSKDSLMALKRQ